MSNQSSNNTHNKPQEEFINEGTPETKKISESRSEVTDYDEYTMEGLHREAKKRNIKGYIKMERKELIHNLVGEG